MTPLLVTLEQASAQVRRDTTDDDADLTLKIRAASRAVLTYLKTPDWADSSGQIPVDTAGIALDVPEDVQIATLMLLSYWYKNREGSDDDTVGGVASFDQGYGYLPRTVVAILFPYRVPTTSAPDASLVDLTEPWNWWRRCGC